MGLKSFFRNILPTGRKFFGGFFKVFFNEATVAVNNYSALSKEGYQKNPYVHASIRTIAVAVAGVPWIAHDVKTGEPKPDADILRLITKPNDKMSGPEFFQWWVSYYELAGDSYILGAGPNDVRQPPMELFTVQPDMVEFKKGKATIGKGADKKEVPPERLLRMRMFNPLQMMKGLSPVEVGARSIVQSNESKLWNISLLQNQARPPGVLSVKGNLTEQQFNRLRDQVDEKYGGSDNAGRPFLGEGGVEWNSLGLSPADMDWLEGQKLSAREIALMFGVPPELIGDSSNKTYSNYREARRAFYEETVLPLMVMIRDKLNNWLMPLFDDGIALDFDTDQVSALQEDRQMLFERLEKARFLRVNEKRHEAGFEDDPAGDVILVGLSEVPLGSEGAGDIEEDAAGFPLNLKSFNMKTGEQKTLYWKAFDARRRRFAARVKTLVQMQLTKDFKAAQKAIRESTTPEAARMASQAAVQANSADWLKLYERVYMSIGQSFAESVFGQLKSEAALLELKAVKQDEQVVDFWLDTIQTWLNKNASLRILGVQDSTNRSVLKVISDGIADGAGIDDMADNIRGLFGANSISVSRAERIARTETIAASNLGSQAAAESTGLPLEKEWITARDARVRGTEGGDKHSHAAMDGQRVTLDGAYTEPLTGEELKFPGDISLGATAGNVINCRCTEGYHVIGEE